MITSGVLVALSFSVVGTFLGCYCVLCANKDYHLLNPLFSLLVPCLAMMALIQATIKKDRGIMNGCKFFIKALPLAVELVCANFDNSVFSSLTPLSSRYFNPIKKECKKVVNNVKNNIITTQII